MTDRPRRVCPVCQRSFMNGRALRDHLYTMRTEPAHATSMAARRSAATHRAPQRPRPRRVFDLAPPTPEEE